jgi:hypothetical protein
MRKSESNVYPRALADLLASLPLAPLGPGTLDASLRARAEAMDEVEWGITDREQWSACRAGLLLAWNDLNGSHRISQELHTVEGSYWHAIMHRREPDHANAAYWFRRVGTHPIFDDLARAAAELGFGSKNAGWDAFAFNDACERHRGKDDEAEEMLRRVQRAEWELLFAWCYRRTVGG